MEGHDGPQDWDGVQVLELNWEEDIITVIFYLEDEMKQKSVLLACHKLPMAMAEARGAEVSQRQGPGGLGQEYLRATSRF